MAPRQAPTEQQKSALLGLFRSPVTQAVEPAKPPTARALPTTPTPSAVELSAVEPLSTYAATTSALLNDKRTPDHINSVPQVNPEANLPFRALSILSRPVELGNQQASPVQSVSIRKTLSKSSGKKASRNQSPATQPPAFQPQILKRPQQASSNSLEPATTSRSTQAALPATLVDHKLAQPADHKQTLLSLFGKQAGAALQQTPTNDQFSLPSTADVHARSRVGSLASGEVAPRRGSLAPISPADNSFLLSYLDAVVAKEAKR